MTTMQIMDADRVIMDAAGVPLEASLTAGIAHRNVVRTVAWVVDRSSCAAPASAPTSRAASTELVDRCIPVQKHGDLLFGLCASAIKAYDRTGLRGRGPEHE